VIYFILFLAKLIPREYKEYSNPHARATTKEKICNKFKAEIETTDRL